MRLLQGIEKQVREQYKGMPTLSKQSKKALVTAWPLIALALGVLQLVAAYWLYESAQVAGVFSDLAQSLSAHYVGNDTGLTATDKVTMYLGVALLVVDGIALLVSYPYLRRRLKRGWYLLFFGILINTVYAIMTGFWARQVGFGPLILGFFGSVASFYLLFQIKDYYVTTTAHKMT